MQFRGHFCGESLKFQASSACIGIRCAESAIKDKLADILVTNTEIDVF